MLAVVLVPLSLLVIACLMERLEARLAPTASVRLAPKRITEEPAADVGTPASARRHLRAVPTLPDDGTDTADGESWSRAS